MSYLFDEVDWSQYDAYAGEFEFDFKKWLGQLLAPDHDENLTAREVLAQWPELNSEEIGRVGAIPDVIACSIQLAPDVPIASRGEVIGLIDWLFDGAPFYATFRRWHGETVARLVERSREAMLSGRQLFIAGLQDEDVEMRRRCAAILRHFSAFEVGPDLLATLRCEPILAVQAALLESLARIRANASPAEVERFLVADDKHVAIRAAELLALLELPLPNRGLHALVAYAAPVLPPQPHQVNMWSFAFEGLRRLPDPAWSIAVHQWVERIPELSAQDVHDYIRLLAALVLPGIPYQSLADQPIPYLGNLVLQALVDSDTYWNDTYWNNEAESMYHDCSGVLSRYDLPHDREELRERLHRLGCIYD